ncbi:hypothetical protein A3X93_10795 [Salmonella enterica subsp. enterica serovar Infantis]|uniref:Inner membrane protein CbrB n=1 Tax=Salmonella infantis TaxID=595 RepID=A0A5Z5HV22_SALIN|nr:hypothetical protein [Salmonella enterica]ECS1908243.1 hypothetical protein [Salmonella enterica subsp. enterica serovar Infantis]ECZ9440876.1 hypothetical protein [Salmonella enterica subsp. enterica serovar Infantis]
MSVFRRIIYHSGWFILLGPLIGAATAIGVINFLPAIIGGPDSFLLYFCRTIPELVIITGWIYSLLPAWLTGVAGALIPLKLYQKIINRMILCAIAGGLITTLFNFARYGFDISILPLIYGEVLIMLIPAIVAGAIMGGVITYLPGLREVKRNNK